MEGVKMTLAICRLVGDQREESHDVISVQCCPKQNHADTNGVE
jgi:hypothetical protein